MTDRRKEKRNNKWRDIAASLCFLSPSLLGVGVFFILPFGVVVYYSMIDGVGTRNFVFLDNFTKLLSISAFLMAARNTLLFSALAVPLAVVLSLALATTGVTAGTYNSVTVDQYGRVTAGSSSASLRDRSAA